MNPLQWERVDVRRTTSSPVSSSVWVATTATLAALVCSLLSLSGLAAAQGEVGNPVDAGAVGIYDVDDPSTTLVEGDSNTVFTLRLPDGASCPGDSAHDDWRVNSFIVPATDDPGALRYGVIWPEGDGRYALYGADTRPYSLVLTGQNATAGLPGRIVAPPPFTLGVFPAGTLTADRYRIGLACTYFRETAIYWDTELVMSDDPDIQPGELRWRLADAPDTAGAGSDSGGTGSIGAFPLVIVSAGALAALALFSLSRRHTRHRVPPLAKEQE